MCGICGAVALDGPLDPRVTAALTAMADAIAHRGPDAEGFYTGERAVLGHRRLSIIDRAGGGQPLANEDGTCWIVFNGEIYNHRGLRQQLLARGHRFRTVSDTETILHGYEEFGTAVVDRLDGMFAFAIHDAKRRETFIARDRLGKKPLYYAVFDGVVHFASEIKALYPSPLWNGELETQAIEEYLSLGYILAPRTIYRHVLKLEPGHWLRISDGRVAVRQYWDVPAFDDAPRRDDAGELESLLRESVIDRLESEVPLGAFLSGGIDSGLVVSFMADALGSNVTTTSVGFSSSAHNELAAAGLTASRFATNHHAQVIQPRLEAVLDRIVSAFDEPFADASAIPTYYVSQMARQHVTVALSGDGGDETFGGYSFRYVPHALEQVARGVAGGNAGRHLLDWFGAHWPQNARLPRGLRLGTILQNIARDPASAYFFDLCQVKPNVVRALMGQPGYAHVSSAPAYDASTAAYRRCSSPSVLQKAMYADLKVYLPNDVLVKVDRMSMQHGLEVRCPLLDHRVVEFGFSTPARRKMPGLRPKQLLRSIAAHRLPSDLLHLPKHGFSAPVGQWIASTHAAMFREQVLNPSSAIGTFVDGREVQRLFDAHCSGRANHGSALWAVWMLERWCSVVRDGAAVSSRTPRPAGNVASDQRR